MLSRGGVVLRRALASQAEMQSQVTGGQTEQITTFSDTVRLEHMDQEKPSVDISAYVGYIGNNVDIPPRLMYKDKEDLRARHRVIASGGVPSVEFAWERERNAQRLRFGQYGLKSGVKLGILWPTVEEIEEEKAIGLYSEYNTALSELKAEQSKRVAQEKARAAEVEKNMKSYDIALKKFEASQVKAEKERDAKEIALEKRIREIQEYFGYWMDPKDPRFEVMLQQKEQEEKKAEKLAKRTQAQKKKIADTS